MLQSKTRLMLIGVSALAVGAAFGWTLTSRIALPTTLLASGALIPTAAAGEEERVEPAREAVTPAPPTVVATPVPAAAPAPATSPSTAPAPAAPTEVRPEGHMVLTGADLRVRKKRHGYRWDRAGTKVSVDRDRGAVRVRAPYTNVRVDGGQVRVRAPYVNLRVGW